jgi:hypothetical protein
MLFREPDEEALADEAAHTAQILLPLYSSSQQPLQIDRAVAVLSDTFSSIHLRYFAEVTLRLRQPLYGPAQSNGTVTYRMLQTSLQSAEERARKAGIFPQGEGAAPPELPRLIQLLHREGEPILVRVPFEARKFGWKWRLQPPQLAKRTATASFDGAPLDFFTDAPSLIFGLPETLGEVRARMEAARNYILAVDKEIHREAAVRALLDGPPP